LAEENDQVVDAFLAAHPEFTQLNVAEVLGKQGIAIEMGERLQLSPQMHDTDGFFAAVLERAAGNA
jgi:16S rRNA (cytosine967-C5)-methyltransferase